MGDPINESNASRPVSRDFYLLARYYLSQRRVQLVLAALLFAAGAWFKWDWLVAAGVAPLLLAFAPCAVMCLLGMCMHKGQGKGGCHGAKSESAQDSKVEQPAKLDS